MTKEEFHKYLKDECNYILLKEIPGRGLCGILEFMFTIGLVHDIGTLSYGGRWCYPKEIGSEAFIAIASWDGQGDPPGDWVKYKGSTEYRNPKLE